ncbi:MAG: Aminotransferase class-III [Candidatus Gottesmanbacteria bacterium GW2011_GWA2_42_16]|nr:MAG: Aminotransferase class-III [Candidatus Gottesmanbacteria bacterium GW2011_GWA2_42_16]
MKLSFVCELPNDLQIFFIKLPENRERWRLNLVALKVSNYRYRAFLGDWRIPVIRLPYPDVEYSTYLKTEEAFVNAALDSVDRITRGEIGGVVTNKGEGDIAALIIEPVLNAGGIVKPPKRYLEAVVKRFRELGALIVVDEIFCGFHRTGPMFGFEHYDFIPDIVILSKALTNGLAPLSCVWAKNPYMMPERFPPGTHSSTFTNNTLSLAIADTVLDRYAQWKTIHADVNRIERKLSEMISAVVKEFPIAKSGYAIGALGRIVLRKNIAGQIDDFAMTIARKNAVNGFHGAILASTGLSPHVLAINPPLTITQRELEVLRILLIQTFAAAQSLL